MALAEFAFSESSPWYIISYILVSCYSSTYLCIFMCEFAFHCLHCKQRINDEWLQLCFTSESLTNSKVGNAWLQKFPNMCTATVTLHSSANSQITSLLTSSTCLPTDSVLVTVISELCRRTQSAAVVLPGEHQTRRSVPADGYESHHNLYSSSVTRHHHDHSANYTVIWHRHDHSAHYNYTVTWHRHDDTAVTTVQITTTP